jgi:uncharacterized protein YyaL (SSP411 family)
MNDRARRVFVLALLSALITGACSGSERERRAPDERAAAGAAGGAGDAGDNPSESKPRRADEKDDEGMTHKHTNRLAHETSPYLLQHAHNPVDWYPWGEEAFEKARREDKPVFLSIGYSACHWCHVMERESFENDSLAAILNERFVAIKVDREERPDIDGIYMKAVQMLTGHGGWPLSAFLTPDGRPFYGGTYYPPTRRQGMPGFGDVLVALSEEYKRNRSNVVGQAEQILAHLEDRDDFGAPGELSWAPIQQATSELHDSFDGQGGGFGTAPKFPPSMAIRLLLREHVRTASTQALDMATITLDNMAAGGMYDHLGGGFARYSTDAQWLVPHFEKMLYDNALLAAVYLEAYLVTGNENYVRVVRETLDYELRDMRDDAGGFHSAEDADSEGEEGKFYVWTHDEVMAVLGAEMGRIFAAYYDVTASGNWEGRAILNTPRPLGEVARELGVSEERAREAIAEGRAKLLEVRGRRVRPGVDDKMLVAWNGLIISSLARAGAALDEPRYTRAAEEAARFIRAKMATADGRLLRSYRAGKAKGAAFLEDYASLANALVDLYEATFDPAHLNEAVRLAEVMLSDFADPEGGGFYFTPANHESLIVRLKDPYDAATPSGNSLAVGALLRLARLCDRDDFRAAAERTLETYAEPMARAPRGFHELLVGLSRALAPSQEVAIVGRAGDERTAAMLRAVRARFLPSTVVAFRDPSAGASASPDVDKLIPLLEGKLAVEGAATAYVCENYACRAPTTDVAALERELR